MVCAHAPNRATAFSRAQEEVRGTERPRPAAVTALAVDAFIPKAYPNFVVRERAAAGGRDLKITAARFIVHPAGYGVVC
jgi:hypothetical protein